MMDVDKAVDMLLESPKRRIVTSSFHEPTSIQINDYMVDHGMRSKVVRRSRSIDADPYSIY